MNVDGNGSSVENLRREFRILAEGAGRVKRGLAPGKPETEDPQCPVSGFISRLNNSNDWLLLLEPYLIIRPHAMIEADITELAVDLIFKSFFTGKKKNRSGVRTHDIISLVF